MSEQPTISTHVLDAEQGRPGTGYAVALYLLDGGREIPVGSGTTDDDGRIRRLLDGELVAGEYRIEVEIGGPFFRRASITFSLDDVGRSCHVPLLISPFSLTTYRGS